MAMNYDQNVANVCADHGQKNLEENDLFIRTNQVIQVKRIGDAFWLEHTLAHLKPSMIRTKKRSPVDRERVSDLCDRTQPHRHKHQGGVIGESRSDWEEHGRQINLCVRLQKKEDKSHLSEMLLSYISVTAFLISFCSLKQVWRKIDDKIRPNAQKWPGDKLSSPNECKS